MENRQVEFMLNQVMHLVLKGAWLELILVVDHQHDVLIVVVNLEARHADHYRLFSRLYQNLAVKGVFLQPQRFAKRQPKCRVGCRWRSRFLRQERI